LKTACIVDIHSNILRFAFTENQCHQVSLWLILMCVHVGLWGLGGDAGYASSYDSELGHYFASYCYSQHHLIRVFSAKHMFMSVGE